MRRRNPRRGIAIVMVLVLIVMISLGAYTFSDMMRAQQRATIMAGRRAQAEAAVASGVEYIKDYLSMLPEDQQAAGGHWDNANYFKDVVVSEDPANMVRFSVLSIVQNEFGDPTGIRYGLLDEGSKINVNTLATSDLFKSKDDQGLGGAAGDGAADDQGGDDQGGGDETGGDQGGGDSDGGGGPGGVQVPGGGAVELLQGGRGDDDLSQTVITDPAQFALMQLPGMTETIADSILDWIDGDDVARPLGAEADMYSAVVGYEPANAPIASLDELLLVQGVTPELLYGADRNHNGIIDANEEDAAAALGGTTGSMARGWSAYLTVNSKDVPYQSADVEPVDLNQDDLEALYDEVLAAGFDEDFATYVVVYRQSGPYTQPEIPEDAPDDFELPEAQPIDGREPDFGQQGSTEIASVLDLIGSSVQAKFAGEGPEQQQVLVASPYGDDSDLAAILPQLMANFTAGEEGGTGRINTNHCAGPVLSGIPDLEPETVQAIQFAQDPGVTSGDLNYMYPTWPLATGAVTVEQMKAMLPYVSGRGAVFRAQVVGYSDVPGAYARAEVVIDASGEAPRVLSWRNLSHLGPGFTIETLMSQ